MAALALRHQSQEHRSPVLVAVDLAEGLPESPDQAARVAVEMVA
jgi:hypothetical protein